MIKTFLLVSTLLVVSNTANAVYKCKDPAHQKGEGYSGVIYSNVPCASDAEKIDVEEPEWRKQQIEGEIRNKKLLKEAQEQEAYRIWKEEEPIRIQNEIRAAQEAQEAKFKKLEAQNFARERETKRLLKKIEDESSRPKSCYVGSNGIGACF